MRRLGQIIFTVLILSGFAGRGHGAVLLDDTFADGTRNNQNLPTDSAWFCSSGASLTATTGAMNLAVGSSSIMALTYFTPNSASPAQLNVGDTLTVSIKFTFSGVAANTSQGFRLGLFDFADATSARTAADGFSTSGLGTNVQGYAVFQNMSPTFSSASPMDIRKRTTVADKDLLGTSGDWTSQITGPGNTNSFPGFASGTQYDLQIVLQRLDANSLAVTFTWVNLSSGASLSTAFTDTGATAFNFDGLALRPSGASSSASTITFNEVKVDLTSGATPPDVTADPQPQTVFVGQDAVFTVDADGTAPLNYQWYFNTNTPLTDATNSTLTVADAQTNDAGFYSVVVGNAFGSVTSDVASLTVNIPTPPAIVAQPQSQTVLPGESVTFNVQAGGSEPLNYQWFYNADTPLPGATDSTLTLTNVQPADAGVYSVVVSNFVGIAVSSNATLSINTNPVAPVFTTQPVSLVVLTGDSASFTAAVFGTDPISYQWDKNGVPIPGATNSTLNLVNAQAADAGSYTLTASNSVGGAVSDVAVLTVTTSIPVVNTEYNLVGFAQSTTGGGVIPDTDPGYAKVTTPLELANAVLSFNKGNGIKVIEIMNDLDLGWNEIGSDVQNLASTPFESATAPKLHPRLLTTGVSKMDIKGKNGGLTIFSANGATIRHCTFNIKSTHNIIVRNLKFDELWEWDEASKGQYDENDWDFITVGNGGAVSNLWVDHCTFTKSYDGILDTKAGSSAITISWCKYTGDDGATNPNSFVWQQINSLESNKTSYAMYNFLRNNGFSTTNIVTIMQGHDKTHLAGQNDLDSANATISMTFHHLWLNSVWDRCVPRLRAGNVHDFNIYVDDTSVLAAKRLRNAIAATMSTANQNTLNNTYDFDPPINGAISTESGALLLEKSVYIDCLTPLRNNQTDPSDPEYTGKILGLDVIYHMDNADGSVTDVRGNSTDSGNPLGPIQAPVIPFSWNLPDNQLPYSYTPDDPSQLKAIVTSPTAGAGAGVLTWDKTNWLVTSYAPTAPFIVSQPQNLTIAPGQTATFTVLAGGSASLNYQWFYNTNTPLPNATNSTLTLDDVQTNDAGVYSVVVTNSAGTVTSTNAALLVSSGSPTVPQLSNVTFSNGTFTLTIQGDSGLDYIVQASTNLTDWENIFTNHSATTPFTWSDPGAGGFSRRFYRIQVGQ